MKITCPKGCEGEFYVAVHVIEEWRCDSSGKLTERVEFIEGPESADADNIFVCVECGEEAEVTT